MMVLFFIIVFSRSIYSIEYSYIIIFICLLYLPLSLWQNDIDLPLNLALIKPL